MPKGKVIAVQTTMIITVDCYCGCMGPKGPQESNGHLNYSEVRNDCGLS